MKLIKSTLLGVVLLFGAFGITNAQHAVTVDVSQNITNFRFTNSAGDKVKDYNPEYSTSYTFGYQYSLDNDIFLLGKLGMRDGGASYVYDTSNYMWDLKYADFRLGAGYTYALGTINLHGSLSGYMGFLLQAKQVINNENFDIKDSGDISNNDFGVFISPGVDYPVSESLSLYLDLNYMIGLKNLETNSDQESKNTLFGISIGATFSL